MRKYLIFALPFFVIGLLLLSPSASHASLAHKSTVQRHSGKLTGTGRITIAPAEVQGKKKISKRTSHSKALRLASKHGAVGTKKRAGKKHGRAGKQRASHVASTASAFEGISGLDELRQHYQIWRGTRYRAGGSSRAGVDCSGFTALTFRDIYGIALPRTAREQAMSGMPVDRDSLLPGDLVFFKRRSGGDHVGIYLGDGKFMHASSHQGVIISSLQSLYWNDRFWRGVRL